MLNEAFLWLISTKFLQNTSRGRSSRLEMIFKISALKDFAIFTGNTCAGVVKACNFIKKRLQHKCFPVNITKILRTAFL